MMYRSPTAALRAVLRAHGARTKSVLFTHDRIDRDSSVPEHLRGQMRTAIVFYDGQWGELSNIAGLFIPDRIADYILRDHFVSVRIVLRTGERMVRYAVQGFRFGSPARD